jgi:uncharacterized protein YjbJ (UPF0337 family)
MDEIQVKGNWNKIKGKAKEIYGSITDDTLKEYEGKYDQLVGYLQEKTGKARDEITSQLEDFKNEHEESEATQTNQEEAHEREGKDIF